MTQLLFLFATLTFVNPSNIDTTRPTPTGYATSGNYSDGVETGVSRVGTLRTCIFFSSLVSTPALELGQPVAKRRLAILVGTLKLPTNKHTQSA